MRTFIWTLPTRLFHWLLAIGFTVAYISCDFDNLINLHLAFGSLVGSLIFFRILFDLFGSTYSNFKDFPIGLRKLKEFMTTYFRNTKEYAGHNPAASLIMLLILLVGLTCCISGYLFYAVQNDIFSIGITKNLLKNSHEFTAGLFLVLVCIHLAGITADTVFHGKTGTLKSIFSGYKNIKAKNVKLNALHKVIIICWFIIPFYIFYLAFGLPINSKEKVDKLRPKETKERIVDF